MTTAGPDRGTAKPKIVLIEPIHENGIDIFSPVATVVVCQGTNDPRLASELNDCDAIVVRSISVDARMMASAPNLKVIGRHGAGVDNIDLAEAQALGIQVVSTPRSNTDSVAEYVIMCILVQFRRLLEIHEAFRNGLFAFEAGSLPSQVVRMNLVGRDVSGARLSLCGFGAIGRAVARRAIALGMQVTAYDPFVSEPELEAAGVKRAEDLSSLLQEADVLSIHMPGNAVDRPILGARELAQLPDGAVVINSARGSLIDVVALQTEAATGRLSAVIDVFDPEPPAPNDTLLHSPGILVTPHMAAMTHQSLSRMAVDVADAVLNELETLGWNLALRRKKS